MTNAELISKIKDFANEQKELLNGFELQSDFRRGETTAYSAIISFLSTLESEKPINPDAAMKELDEKIALVKQRGTWDGVDVDKYMDEVRGREPEKPVPKDLEEAADEHVNNIAYCGDDIELEKEQSKRDFISGAKWQENKDQETIKLAEDHAFLAGADWQKEQMMKEGDEGIVRRAGPIGYITFTDEQQFDSRLEQFQDCDKVRIIIVKEDEK